MQSALYYPHSTIRDESLLKNALLLWDVVDVIVPFDGFKPYGGSKQAERALEIIARPRAPSDDEKAVAHDRVLRLIQADLPDWFKFEPANANLGYQIYPQKFMPDTWDALRASKLAEQYNEVEFGDYVLSKWLGLSVMSILAECCAGETRRLVTDEEDSYAALGRCLMAETGGVYRTADTTHERLVTLSIDTIGLRDVTLAELCDLRENESAFMRTLRHNYLAAVDSFVAQAANVTRKNDRLEIERIFRQKLEDEIKDLQKALRRGAISTLLSKEMCVAVLAAAGAMIEPWTSSVVAVGALGKSLVEYRAGREETMRKSATAWLYAAKAKIPFV